MSTTNETKERPPSHYSHDGRYNLCDNNVERRVTLITAAATISAFWDPADCPYDETMLPSEVSAIIRKRFESYWIHTGRKEALEKLDAIDARAQEFDAAWLRDQATRARTKAASLLKDADNYENQASDIEVEMAQ